MRKKLLFIALALSSASCATQTELYDWKGYDSAVYSYIKRSDEKSIESLMERCEKLIKSSEDSKKVPPPGICADYGYLLIQNGKIKEGKAFLTKETVLYPESKQFVDRILKRFD